MGGDAQGCLGHPLPATRVRHCHHKHSAPESRVKFRTQGNSTSRRLETGKGCQRCERQDRAPLGAVLVGQGREMGPPGHSEWVGRVLQASLHPGKDSAGPLSGSPSPSPAASLLQGWQGTREIKQAISKAERKAAIWALADRSFNEQREFSREAGEMQQCE